MNFALRVILAASAGMGAFAGVAALIFVVPRYKRTWDDFGARLSLPQQILIEISDYASRYWYVLLPVIGVAVALFIVMPLFGNRPSRDSVAND